MADPEQPMNQLDQPRQGILFLLAGLLLFSIQDVTIKWISDSYPVHQIVVVRALLALLPLLLILQLEGGFTLLRTRRLGGHLSRSAAMFMAYTCFYLALAAMPLADTVALTFSSPLFLTALSILILGERASLRRWIAVATGFVGVLIILRPGFAAFEPAALLALAGALFYALGGVQTRRLGGTESASAMAVYTTLFYLAAGSLIGLIGSQRLLATGGGAAAASMDAEPVHASLQFLLRPWALPTWPDLGRMALLGVIAALGFYLLSQAYRVARVTAVAPFEYLSVPLSVALGYLVWGDLPTGYTIAGAALVVGSGLYVLRREAVREEGEAGNAPALDGARSGTSET